MPIGLYKGANDSIDPPDNFNEFIRAWYVYLSKGHHKALEDLRDEHGVDSWCCFGNRGNVNSDNQGSTSVADITFLVNYIFHNGQTPPCFDEANVNGDATITIADINVLVGYLFNNGPAPGPCPTY